MESPRGWAKPGDPSCHSKFSCSFPPSPPPTLPSPQVFHKCQRLACCPSEEWHVNTSGPSLLPATLPPASEQSWTGFSLASCSLHFFSSRITAFTGLPLSPEVSEEVSLFVVPSHHPKPFHSGRCEHGRIKGEKRHQTDCRAVQRIFCK